jgi:hypothetical protein
VTYFSRVYSYLHVHMHYHFIQKYLQFYPKHVGFVNKPIVKYAQMKIVFTTRHVRKQQLYQPHLLIKVLNYIVESKDKCAKNGMILPGERRARLTIWLRTKFPWSCSSSSIGASHHDLGKRSCKFWEVV